MIKNLLTVKNVAKLFVMSGLALGFSACNGNGGSNTMGSGGANLVVDTIAPVPLVNGQTANYSVYVKNLGQTKVSGLSFKISNNGTSAVVRKYVISKNLSDKTDIVPTIDSSGCNNIAAGSSCRISLKTGSIGTLSVVGELNGKEVVSFSSSTYPLTVTNSVNLSDALILGNYPSTMVLQSNRMNPGSYYGSMSLSIVNQYNAPIDVSDLLGTLPTNVTWSPINCPNPLPFAGVCQVRLTYNGLISSNITVNLRPSGEVINRGGGKTALPTQSSNGGIGVTKSKIASLNVSYPSLGLDGNNPTTGNTTTGYIRNNGTGLATISGLTINNNSSSLFSISSNGCTGKLAAGATCQYTITSNVEELSAVASGNYSNGITVKYNNGTNNTQAIGQLSYSYIAVNQSGSQIVVTPGLSISGIIPSSMYAGAADPETVQLTLMNNTTATNGGNTTIEVARDSLINNIGTNLSGTLNITGITTNACNISGANISLNGSQSCVVNLVLTGNGEPSTTAATIAPTYQYYSYTSTSTTPNLTSATGAQLPTLSGSVTIEARSASLNLAFFAINGTTAITSLSVEQGLTNPTAVLRVTNTGATALTGIMLPNNILGFTFTPDSSCGTLAANASCNVDITLSSANVIAVTDITTNPANIVNFSYSNHLGTQIGSSDMPSLTYQVSAPNTPIITVSSAVINCGSGSTITQNTSNGICNLNPGVSGPGTTGGYVFQVRYTISGADLKTFNVSPNIGLGNYDVVGNSCGGATTAGTTCAVNYELTTLNATSGNILSNTSLGLYNYTYGIEGQFFKQQNVLKGQDLILNIAQPSLSLSVSRGGIGPGENATATATVSSWYAANVPVPSIASNNSNAITVSGTTLTATSTSTNLGQVTIIASAAGITQTSTATIRKTYFKSYYPSSCSTNGSVGVACECIKDPAQDGKVWTAVGPNNRVTIGSWNDWTGSLLTTYNSTSNCGLKDGWSLPDTGQSPTLNNFMSSSNPGGDWSSIATAAGMNGNSFAIGNWMNNNGFKNINTGNVYWSSQSNNNTFAWAVGMLDGNVRGVRKLGNPGVLLVHP